MDNNRRDRARPTKRKQPPPKFYTFHTDHHCLFLGQSLRPWLGQMRIEFRSIVLLVAACELLLLSWPIVATIIWKERAFLTWIHFIYLFRGIFLLAAAVSVRYPHRLYGSGDYTGGWNAIRIHGAFSIYWTMAWWMRIAVIHGIVLTTLFFLGTLGMLPVFLDNNNKWPMLLWGLSLGFHILAFVQTWVSIYAIWRLGVYKPVVNAYNKARRKGTEATPRKLNELEIRTRRRLARERIRAANV